MSIISYNRETTGAQIVAAHGDSIQGKTILITGASTGGLGAQTALDLAAGKPAHLILTARSVSKVQPVIDQVASISPATKAIFVAASLDDLDSVRDAANKVTQLLGSDGKIDILINNAGIMAKPFSLSKQGVESQFATNHLGHFLLTARLWPLIARAGPAARVINVTSDGYRIGPFRPDDVNFSDGKEYDVWSGYGQSKTANILFTKGLAKRGVVSFTVHPGVILGTSITDGLDRTAFGQLDETTKKNTGLAFVMGEPKTIEQGVAGNIRAAIDPGLKSQSGAYLADVEVEDVLDHAKDEIMVEKLWSISEDLVGEKFELSG